MGKIRVSIIGATGYSGKELLRLLLKHPQVELVHLVSASYVGQNINEIFPEFYQQLNKKLIGFDVVQIRDESDVVFTALPHTVSLDIVPELLSSKRIKVIDLSADFRLRKPSDYHKWYQKEHTEQSKAVLSRTAYGLPELYKEEIKRAILVANPGCYPTGAILGIAPLLAHRLAEPTDIIIDAKSGTSGAGRKLSLGLHFTECNESFKAYSVIMHKHIPEIEQELTAVFHNSSDRKKGAQQREIIVSFTPHLLPINRGILSTCYLTLKKSYELAEIITYYRKFYQEAPFVRIFTPPTLPELRFVQFTNYCDIGLVIDERVGRIKIISAIDNLTKGASGQAIQNMNIMFNLPEQTGLIN